MHSSAPAVKPEWKLGVASECSNRTGSGLVRRADIAASAPADGLSGSMFMAEASICFASFIAPSIRGMALNREKVNTHVATLPMSYPR